MLRTSILSLASAVALLVSGPASAMVIDFEILATGNNARDAVDPAQSVAQDGFTFNASLDQGSTGGENISPYGAGTTTPYYAVGNSNAGNLPNPAVLTLDPAFGLAGTLTLLWGTIDSLNTIEFFKGSSSIGTLTGATVENGSSIGVGLVEVTVDGGFDRVLFSNLNPSGQPFNAFEFGSVTVAAVPLPATLPLILSSVIGLGLVARRRRRKDIA